MTWLWLEKQGALPPAIFLAVNNHSNICFGDFCFVMKITILGEHVQPGSLAPSIQIQ